MPRFKSLPNLILTKISFSDHAQPAMGWSLIQAEVFPLALTAGNLLLLYSPTKQKVHVHRGGTAVPCHTKGSWSPAACLQQGLITHAKSITWGQMYSIHLQNVPPCPTVCNLGNFLRQTSYLWCNFFVLFPRFGFFFSLAFKPCKLLVSTAPYGMDFPCVTTSCVNRHILLCALLAAFIWCPWYL